MSQINEDKENSKNEFMLFSQDMADPLEVYSGPAPASKREGQKGYINTPMEAYKDTEEKSDEFPSKEMVEKPHEIPKKEDSSVNLNQAPYFPTINPDDNKPLALQSELQPKENQLKPQYYPQLQPQNDIKSIEAEGYVCCPQQSINPLNLMGINNQIMPEAYTSGTYSLSNNNNTSNDCFYQGVANPNVQQQPPNYYNQPPYYNQCVNQFSSYQQGQFQLPPHNVLNPYKPYCTYCHNMGVNQNGSRCFCSPLMF